MLCAWKDDRDSKLLTKSMFFLWLQMKAKMEALAALLADEDDQRDKGSTRKEKSKKKAKKKKAATVKKASEFVLEVVGDVNFCPPCGFLTSDQENSEIMNPRESLKR